MEYNCIAEPLVADGSYVCFAFQSDDASGAQVTIDISDSAIINIEVTTPGPGYEDSSGVVFKDVNGGFVRARTDTNENINSVQKAMLKDTMATESMSIPLESSDVLQFLFEIKASDDQEDVAGNVFQHSINVGVNVVIV